MAAPASAANWKPRANAAATRAGRRNGWQVIASRFFSLFDP
jgi:hypothetical protein